MAQSWILDSLESGLLRGREVDSLLMHAFTPITHTFHYFGFSLFFSFFFVYVMFSFFLSIFLYLLFIIFLFLFSSPFLLCTSMAFYTACRDKICHFYHSTAFGLLWVSFQNCQLVCQLPSHHHYTILVMPSLIPWKKVVLFCLLLPLALPSG